jgi:hypothetical protein
MPGNELLSNAQSEDVEILAPTFFRAESEGNSRRKCPAPIGTVAHAYHF